MWYDDVQEPTQRNEATLNVYVFPIHLHIAANSAAEAEAIFDAAGLEDGPLTIHDDLGRKLHVAYANVDDVTISEDQAAYTTEELR